MSRYRREVIFFGVHNSTKFKIIICIGKISMLPSKMRVFLFYRDAFFKYEYNNNIYFVLVLYNSIIIL